MSDRAVPPADIHPEEFFTRWVPASVAADESRQLRLARTDAVLEFILTDHDEGIYHLRVAQGIVVGVVGEALAPDLRVHLDIETWQSLNAGELSAPEAFLKRRVRIEGDFTLALKLHLILG
ncbi:MAG: SCP2 sterol-binding domain-containing protein [Deltaproteobacteria bacterium]|nr:SCP2 sterol-binding domain-containing protein [Deltaproteobacteria bacterium]MBW2393154.1 SCP2 sterol-binding domain-containing protein [Deltaproteobacteria bacterium]